MRAQAEVGPERGQEIGVDGGFNLVRRKHGVRGNVITATKKTRCGSSRSSGGGCRARSGARSRPARAPGPPVRARGESHQPPTIGAADSIRKPWRFPSFSMSSSPPSGPRVPKRRRPASGAMRPPRSRSARRHARYVLCPRRGTRWADAGGGRPHRRDRDRGHAHRRRGSPQLQHARGVRRRGAGRTADSDRRTGSGRSRASSECENDRAAERTERTGLRRDDLHIDIGATSAEDAARASRPGDVGVWHGEPLELPNGRIVSRALDNRLGAYAALEAARRIAEAGDAPRSTVVAIAVRSGGDRPRRRADGGVRARARRRARDRCDVGDRCARREREAGREGRARLRARRSLAAPWPTVSSRICSSGPPRQDAIPHTIEVLAGPTHTDADAVHVAGAACRQGSSRSRFATCTRRASWRRSKTSRRSSRSWSRSPRRLTPDTSFVR